MGTAATPTPVRVNGFGTAANHTHSLLALPDGVLLLATHYGLFRSVNDGETWQIVASGPNQQMQDLMSFSLVDSSLNTQRLYVLGIPVISNPQGAPGLYTSTNQGITWSLVNTMAALGNMYFVAAGNDTPDQMYLYLNELGANGLKVSMDGGEHFSATGTLPFGSLSGLLAVPGAPGQLLAYGDSGVARSTDSGAHWQVLSSINGAVFQMTTAGAHAPIYGSGDAGIYVSQNGGKSFALVYTQYSYNALTSSPTQPQVVYGKLATGVFKSIDGGRSWSSLPPIRTDLQVLAVDPTDPTQLYAALNYPTQVYRYDQSDGAWLSLTPRA